MPFDFEESRIDAAGRRLGARRLDVDELLSRLLWFVRGKIRAGDWSVRSLAAELGCSQPHLNNVVTGKRPLTCELADAILWHFRIDLLDLLGPAERFAYAERCAMPPEMDLAG